MNTNAATAVVTYYKNPIRDFAVNHPPLAFSLVLLLTVVAIWRFVQGKFD